MSQFTRTELMLGAEGMARLRAARVTVVGLGAVGSYVTEALARAGVGHLRLIDGDVVQESNLNRQLYALHSTVGRAKAELAGERVRDINPACEVWAQQLFVNQETLAEVLEPLPDVLVDAIDSVGPKVGLLAAASMAGVPFILSSMGAASRRDFRMIDVADIAETRQCPLARYVRKYLRRKGVRGGIRCVYSAESAPAVDAELPGEPDPSWQGRPRRPLPSLPTLTGMFGLVLAQEAIVHIAGNGLSQEPEEE